MPMDDPSNLSRNLPPEVADALAKGNVIEALKIVRQQKNIGLAEAKSLLEALQKQGNVKVNVKTTVRTTRRPAGNPVAEQHPGLSPGEVPRGGAGPAIAVIVLVALFAIGVAIYLKIG